MDELEYYKNKVKEIEEELDENKRLWVLRADSLHEKIKELEAEIEKLKGKSTGGRVPFGYKCPDGTNLVEDTEQQQIISVMRKMREKDYSYREISRKIKEIHKIEISHSGVRKILNRDPEPKTKFVF
jgi:DNA repair exonuclease SbcCD ATPase subunit